MTTSKYEDLYVATRKAKIATQYVNKAIEVFRFTDVPVTPQEIGIHLFGEDYLKKIETNYPYHYCGEKASQRAIVGQIMRHLHAAGLVKRVYLDGDPIEIEHKKWVFGVSYDVPRMIKVHDDEGNTYTIENPNWDWLAARAAQESGHYETVKETITPKIKAWAWVEG